MRREEDVAARARWAALEQSGTLDVWVNNAGITCFAPLDSERFEEHREGALLGAPAPA